jgi:hypothetical protein
MRYIIKHIFLFTGILIFVAFLSRISKTALYDGFFSKIQEISVRNSQSVPSPALCETQVSPDNLAHEHLQSVDNYAFADFQEVIKITTHVKSAFSTLPILEPVSRFLQGLLFCRAP